MSAKEMELWLSRFEKTPKLQEIWDTAIETAHKLPDVKEELDRLVNEYEASGKIASSALFNST